VVRLWGLFEIASSYRQTVYLKRRCAACDRRQFETGSVLQAVAIDGPLH